MDQLEPAWSTKLSPAMITKAESEFGETIEVKREAIEQLRCLIEKTTGFCPPTEESFLLRFLRHTKYDVPKAFQSLKNYVASIAKYSGYISDLTPRDVEKILEMNKVFFAPTIHPDHGAVFVASIGTFDLNLASVEHHMAATLCVALAALEDTMQVCGLSAVIDFKDYTMRHVLKYASFSVVNTTSHMFKNACVHRVKAMHSIHEPPYYTYLFNNIWKYLLPKKIRNRVFFHGNDLSSLHRCIPKEQLPESLGGTLGASDFTNFRQEMYKRQEMMERLRTYVYNGKSYPLPLHSMWKRETLSSLNN